MSKTWSSPVVLLGEFTAGKAPATPYLERFGWGRMWVTKGPHFEYEGEPFGVDNGAFSAWRKGKPWDSAAFLRRLDAVLASARMPVLAIAPDIVAGGVRSLEFSLSWRDRLPDGLPWYLAVQDGMTQADVEPFVGRFSGIFLGGTDRFKRSVVGWRRWTHGLGLPLHWGRCGTARRLHEAIAVGVDSLDSVTPVLKIGEGRVHLMDSFARVYAGKCPQALFPWG
jgi:hypothetical protein